MGTCQSQQGSTPTPTPRLSAGCEASKGRVTAKRQRTCSPDRVTSHHTRTQCCHPVVKPRVLLRRGLRKMWLSIGSPNRESKFAIFCSPVLLCLVSGEAQRTRSMGCSESPPGLRPSRRELVITITGTGSAFLELHTRGQELHTHGQEHRDLHSLTAGRWGPRLHRLQPLL